MIRDPPLRPLPRQASADRISRKPPGTWHYISVFRIRFQLLPIGVNIVIVQYFDGMAHESRRFNELQVGTSPTLMAYKIGIEHCQRMIVKLTQWRLDVG